MMNNNAHHARGRLQTSQHPLLLLLPPRNTPRAPLAQSLPLRKTGDETFLSPPRGVSTGSRAWAEPAPPPEPAALGNPTGGGICLRFFHPLLLYKCEDKSGGRG